MVHGKWSAGLKQAKENLIIVENKEGVISVLYVRKIDNKGLLLSKNKENRESVYVYVLPIN